MVAIGAVEAVHVDRDALGGRRARNRRLLLDAATELFLTRGRQVTTIDDICERAGVVQRTFFNHFASRGELVRSLAEERSRAIATQIDELAPTSPEPGCLLDWVVGQMAERGAESGPRYRELVVEMVGHDGPGVAGRTGVLGTATRSFVNRSLDLADRPPDIAPEVIADLIAGALIVNLNTWVGDPDHDLASSLQACGDAINRLVAPAEAGARTKANRA